ncbi:hypothetical protein NDU88_004886 [Pleurodeles waltl]|uniref:Uncharacterized protein n=1 Tax=Pleurodeles waltl TaxID=8319 RepID=A0AAV7SK66_PLEWA|nr:hypothetical protein NDU88_004886 [Pleurodeles waltl]
MPSVTHTISRPFATTAAAATRPAWERLTGAHRSRPTAVTGNRGVRFLALLSICWVLDKRGPRVRPMQMRVDDPRIH